MGKNGKIKTEKLKRHKKGYKFIFKYKIKRKITKDKIKKGSKNLRMKTPCFFKGG
jgi:hypothetical protein